MEKVVPSFFRCEVDEGEVCLIFNLVSVMYLSTIVVALLHEGSKGVVGHGVLEGVSLEVLLHVPSVSDEFNALFCFTYDPHDSGQCHYKCPFTSM